MASDYVEPLRITDSDGDTFHMSDWGVSGILVGVSHNDEVIKHAAVVHEKDYDAMIKWLTSVRDAQVARRSKKV